VIGTDGLCCYYEKFLEELGRIFTETIFICFSYLGYYTDANQSNLDNQVGSKNGLKKINYSLADYRCAS